MSPLDDADGVKVWLVSRGRFHKADTRTWMESMDMADFLQDSLGTSLMGRVPETAPRERRAHLDIARGVEGDTGGRVRLEMAPQVVRGSTPG